MRTYLAQRSIALPTFHPVGRVATAAQWVSAIGHGHVHTVADPVLVSRPHLPDCNDPTSVQKVQRFVAPAAQVAELPSAQVWSPDGIVITSDGCVVEDLTRAWGMAFEDHPIWEAEPVPAHHVTGTAATVAARGAATNFSHFLADTLPRIQLIRDAGIDIGTWIVSSLDQPWQREGLALAGIPIGKTVSLTESPLISADTLVVPSRTGFAPMTAPWAREKLVRLLCVPARPHRRQILISRNRADRRRLLNEDEVLDLLVPHGFERVDFDYTPLAEQIRIIHESRTIVTAHGSALGHLLHAPPGGHVVEIANPHLVRPDIWGLAALAGWRHAIAPATPDLSRCSPTDPINHDLVADLTALSKALRRR